MGDANGRARHVIDYEHLEGFQKRRPASMQFGYAAMIRGFQPARIDFAVKDEQKVSGRIVLKRDAGQPTGSPPYLREFDRLRFELSDPSRNERISDSTDR